MSKPSPATSCLPPIAETALRRLGEHLAIARARRKESQRAWAARIGVSVPTLIRMEKGDPSVGMGVYASALWLMGRIQALPDVAAPMTAPDADACWLWYLGDPAAPVRIGTLRLVMGGRGVSRSPDGYEPHRAGALPLLGDVRKVHELVRRVMANEPIPSTSEGCSRPAARWAAHDPRR